MRIAFLAGIGLLQMLAACGPDQPATTSGVFIPAGGLPAAFDCVRENHGIVVDAHRGGPAPGYPENALSTLARAADAGAIVLEVDVRGTRDQELVLAHGEEINGKSIRLTPWEELQTLTLADPAGTPTDQHLVLLEEALHWAEGKAILKLDIKDDTIVDSVVAEVELAGAEDRVILIADSIETAIQYYQLNPHFMQSVTIEAASDLNRLSEAHVDLSRILAWTGTAAPNPALNGSLAALGIEAVFGTLGREGWDVRIASAGNDAQYSEFVTDGVAVLATDRPAEVAAALTADDVAREKCFAGGR